VPIVEAPRPPPPSLSIGRVIVEVRRAAPAAALQAPVIVRVPAAAPAAPAGGFFHRGFGLGQS
jgi:hypothetical protein